MERMILSLIVVASLAAAGCSQQNSAQKPTTSEPQAQVQTVAQQVQSAVQEVAQQAAPVAQEAQQNLTNTANAAVGQAKELLAKAQEMLSTGKFNEAISFAQQVLSFDPQNMDAQKIIETAKAKIAQLAQDKAGELKTGLTNALGN